MKSAELLEMELAYSTEEIIEGVKATVKANRIGRGIIKILAFWGEEAITELVLDSRLDVAIFAIPESEELVMDKKQTHIRLSGQVAQIASRNSSGGCQGLR